ncbi:MAG: glycosyltransferase family 2 protein [Defluviitaleaceae bacterium]|nr:glycosyltransferase family 2 protein [Defluviitaleaceae bacterium]
MGNKIKLIIPVYNTLEEFLRECLESASKQTYPNMEIIVINDGCTDNSPQIIQEYAEKDARFIVINKENAGVNAARNTGMKHSPPSADEYYMFMDSDDYLLDKDIVSDISSLLEESGADMLSYEYKEFFSEDSRPVFQTGSCPREKIYKQTAETALMTLLSGKASVFSAVCHTKVVRANLIHEKSIFFNEDFYRFGDAFFTAQLIKHVKSCDRYNMIALAFRRSNPASLTTVGNKDNLAKLARAQQDLLNHFKINLLTPGNKCLLAFLSSQYAYWLGMMARMPKLTNNTAIEKKVKSDFAAMKEFSFVLKHAQRSEVKIIGMFYAIFGAKLTMRALNIYLRCNRKHVLSINRKMT